jgi:DNA polymerase-3 subunit delta
MPGWIVNKAKALGGKIEQPAAKELATYVGSDTLAATRELEKLLTYVDYHRAVELADVQAVSIDERQGDIFQMIDQMAVGNRREALRLLGLLLQEQDAMALFGMVIRQFRLLIVTRELLDEGRPLAQLNSYGVHQDFLWRKYGDQARRFSLEQLTGIYRRLLEMDLAAKTGGMALDLSLQTLIAEL